MVKEAYQNEYNLHILSQVASATEKSQYNEYMCSECGELYTQAGYKIVQVPMTEANPQPSATVIKTKQPAAVVKTEQPAAVIKTEQPHKNQQEVQEKKQNNLLLHKNQQEKQDNLLLHKSQQEKQKNLLLHKNQQEK